MFAVFCCIFFHVPISHLPVVVRVAYILYFVDMNTVMLSLLLPSLGVRLYSEALFSTIQKS